MKNRIICNFNNFFFRTSLNYSLIRHFINNKEAVQTLRELKTGETFLMPPRDFKSYIILQSVTTLILDSEHSKISRQLHAT